MPKFQVLTCPKCQGAGCPTCKNTGKVKVASDQLQKLKQMISQMPVPIPTPTSQPLQPGITAAKLKLQTNLAGIIAFSILSILAGAAAASWYFLRTLKPFLSGLLTLLVLIGSRLAWHQPFFQPHEPDDFLKAIKLKP